MQSAAITLAMVVAVVLIHLSYIDFRFRYRGGVRWFWLLTPATPLVWISRAAIIMALLLALSTPLIGFGRSFVLLLGVLVLVFLHIISLVLVELLEPR
ncbi:MAG TPA: hypothetical protein VHS33_09015 [Sphingomicrobium sp.]|jgi:hypothetical protein|nr:hypothetical protein [Sphingomicrobium sp.]